MFLWVNWFTFHFTVNVELHVYIYVLQIFYTQVGEAFCGLIKVIHVDHDLTKMFITLAWND